MIIETIIAIVIAMVIGSMTLLVLGMRQRKRDLITTIISPDSIQRHLALVCLIRGVELLVAVAILGGIMLIFAGSLLSLDPWRAHPGLSKAYAITVMIAVPLLLVTTVVVLPAWRRLWSWEGGYFRSILRVDSSSVSNYAFFFAAFASHDFYQLWPFRATAPVHHYPFLDRELLWIFVFFGLWNGIKGLVLGILEMRRKEPPADPADSEPPGSGPYVPFNPYDLSKNQPLRPLSDGS
jgi:hypothetical protein